MIPQPKYKFGQRVQIHGIMAKLCGLSFTIDLIQNHEGLGCYQYSGFRTGKEKTSDNRLHELECNLIPCD